MANKEVFVLSYFAQLVFGTIVHYMEMIWEIYHAGKGENNSRAKTLSG